MVTQYRCKNERRRSLVRQQVEQGTSQLNGIDYLEVSPDQTTLRIYFLHELPHSPADSSSPSLITPDNIRITGGTRLQNLQVKSVTSVGNQLRVHLNQPGDYSPYTLTLIQFDSSPAWLDPQLRSVTFRFWVEEVSEFDCQTPELLTEVPPSPPVIDYLAKDYASFRQLMLDRLSVIMPEWRERNPADVGMVVVELLAYAADHLSYYQDAVATEAYLGTCRRRVSMRRHSRLLDYPMHDGCNARAWVVLRLEFETESAAENWPAGGITLLGPDGLRGRPGVQLLTKTVFPDGYLDINSEDYVRSLNQGAQVFESLHDLTIHAVLDQLCFYTWGDEQCKLPKGAIRATLADPDGRVGQVLEIGRVLLFQSIRGEQTGDLRDADLTHRHAVRLIRVNPTLDPLTDMCLVEIEWAVADVLPFDLFISGIDEEGVPFAEPLSVVYGNVLLADAGRTQRAEDLRDLPGWNRWRPRLTEHPLTRQGYVQTVQGQGQLFDPEAPARAAMQWSLREVRPAIVLWENELPEPEEPGGPLWQPQPDLLKSDRFARDFVVESEDDGRAFLRFGDGTLGMQPPPETPLYALYRTGNGQTDSIGAQTLVNIVLEPINLVLDGRLSPEQWLQLNLLRSAVKPYNPLPAKGGIAPEPIEQVRLNAPQAFQSVLHRAVTEQDYETLTEQYPGVERAVASRRWTGSWYTIFIAVDLATEVTLDDAFKRDLLAYLEEFRLAGHDVAIEPPRLVPLDIALNIQLQPSYFRSAVKAALLDSFSTGVLDDGRLGFFHPNRFTFGQPVYLSQVVSRAMQVEGVQAATVTRFQRWRDSTTSGLAAGVLRFERLEIAQLDNLPSLPENGRLEFQLEGGL